MPTKYKVLELLSRDELLDAVDRLGLPVRDRRARAGLLQVLASSKKAGLHDLLLSLPSKRLRELCRELGLDEVARDKATLIERLTRAKAAERDAETNGGTAAQRAPVAEQVEVSGGEKLTRERLERYLWSAADILRGSIDASDYKNYIFGLLFLKRLSDRFDEECEALRAERADPEDPDEHQFFVPKRARWAALMARSAGWPSGSPATQNAAAGDGFRKMRLVARASGSPSRCTVAATTR